MMHHASEAIKQTLCLKRLGSLLSLRLRSMKKCVARAVSSGFMSHTIRKESQVTSQIWMLWGVERGTSMSICCMGCMGEVTDAEMFYRPLLFPYLPPLMPPLLQSMIDP